MIDYQLNLGIDNRQTHDALKTISDANLHITDAI